jgi:hypothetical protein
MGKSSKSSVSIFGLKSRLESRIRTYCNNHWTAVLGVRGVMCRVTYDVMYSVRFDMSCDVAAWCDVTCDTPPRVSSLTTTCSPSDV